MKKQTVVIAEQNIPEQELRDVVAKPGYDTVSVECEPYEKKGHCIQWRITHRRKEDDIHEKTTDSPLCEQSLCE